MKRTKLSQRLLPNYTKAEELTNSITHFSGAAMGIAVLVLSVFKSIGNTAATISAAIYGFTMILVYTMSGIYHGIPAGTAKKVLQVLDHCSIYFLIAGTYTPILVAGFLPVFPKIGIGLLLFEWVLCVIAVTLTAIDLKKYEVFSMICYIGMGWAIICFIPQCKMIMSRHGFHLLLSGGIVYTIGAVLYGIGSKKPWMHSIFHIAVVLGSLLQFLGIIIYIL